MDGNNHPADELAEVRQQVAELKNREKQLRELLMALPRQERIGKKYWAVVLDKERRVIDVDKLADELGDIKRFYRTSGFVMVKIEKVK
jgi:hypothetical protein